MDIYCFAEYPTLSSHQYRVKVPGSNERKGTGKDNTKGETKQRKSSKEE